ncbi:hypothetical protein CYLTODRAFT_416893 [Cylindrobasidium torrendii FP15055 ss-10]|uniref:Exosome complex protein n=1 Tax=Cylindrobasidium torrendii FP15055 ss-10 TaxID=1314674 RepID=A0A0D7BSX5_9AGAR|nr:hypothetical protein CYLTODRAFT_416893 [Cylindrobasidium torrendii FP15055 ss-10]
MADTSKAKAKLANLSKSLSELEDNLEPLLAQTLPEALLPLDALQQAKLQTTLSYVIHDLVFIYLKSRGIDPRTHPVFGELERVKEYFGKIDKAEASNKQRTVTVDKGAAERFITSAITQAVESKRQAPVVPESSTFVQPVVTEKMLEREAYLKEVRDTGDAERTEDDLDFVDEESGSSKPSSSDRKGKGKVKDGKEGQVLAGRKRRRTAADYMDAPPPSDERVSKAQTDSETKPKKKKVKTKGDGTSKGKTGGKGKRGAA